ncbi:hypothetical protein BDR26DRAFT_851602 [Obelidium mucronatum]|nr:hypothetical protein BDR26DRAFT_851602 [Obelidium mucronatum]
MSLISPIAEIARSSLLATLSTEALPSINPIAFVINSLGGLTAILFDITVLVIFRKNTMATKKEGSDEMDSHFTIVFYAGCVANLAMWMSFGIFIGSSLTDDAFTSSVLLAMFFLSLLVVFADLFTLKVLLFWDKIRKDEIKKSKIESAIGKEEMMRLRARSIDAHGGVGGIFGSRQDSVEYGARFNNSQTTSMSYDLTHSIHRQNSFQKGSIGSRLLHLQNGSMESGINKRGSPDGCMLPSKRESLDNSNVNNVRDSLDSNLSQLLKRASTDYASSRKTSTSSILRQSGLSMEIIKDGSIEHLPMQRSKSARLTPIRNGSVDSDSRDRCVASRSKLSHTFADESKIDSRLRVGGDKTSLDSLIYRGHNSLKRSTNIKEPESLDLMSSIAEVDTNASSYGNAVPSIEPNSLNELIQTDPDFINSEKWSNVGDYSGSEGRLG